MLQCIRKKQPKSSNILYNNSELKSLLKWQATEGERAGEEEREREGERTVKKQRLKSHVGTNLVWKVTEDFYTFVLQIVSASRKNSCNSLPLIIRLACPPNHSSAPKPAHCSNMGQKFSP